MLHRAMPVGLQRLRVLVADSVAPKRTLAAPHSRPARRLLLVRTATMVWMAWTAWEVEESGPRLLSRLPPLRLQPQLRLPRYQQLPLPREGWKLLLPETKRETVALQMRLQALEALVGTPRPHLSMGRRRRGMEWLAHIWKRGLKAAALETHLAWVAGQMAASQGRPGLATVALLRSQGMPHHLTFLLPAIPPIVAARSATVAVSVACPLNAQRVHRNCAVAGPNPLLLRQDVFPSRTSKACGLAI